MKKNVGLTDMQIELLLKCLQTIIQISKVLTPPKFSTEKEISKIAEYAELYEIIAEQYYEEPNILKKIS